MNVEHYYSEKPSTRSAPQQVQMAINGQEMTLTTDVGVFSRRSVDFGTKLLIESFQFPNVAGPILDIGCGYGPIGLALAKRALDRRIVMTDVNERALRLAEQNRQANHVDNATVVKSNLFENVPHEQYAAILSNPPIRAGKKVVYELFRKAYTYLKPGGEFWIVIQKKQGAPSAKNELTSIFGDVNLIKRAKGYFIFQMIKKG